MMNLVAFETTSQALEGKVVTAIPKAFSGTMYSEFLSELCKQRGSKLYLEIGVQFGHNLAYMEVDRAIGIDPSISLKVDPTFGKRQLELYRMSSDTFFSTTSVSNVELAFLDGMHLFEFLLRDFYNVEASAAKIGLITMHDCLPLDGDMISRVDVGIWTGDVWKIVPILEKYRPDLKVVCVDCNPTGLVCVTNLDPSSTVLKDRYCDIVEEFYAMPNDLEALEEFYKDRKIIKASDISSGFRQSLYFKT